MTDDMAGVGWDGGAVGNHVQLLYDDGQSQLLLDPTIGAVVNGVTLDGLINGTGYFNTHVINAVEHGSYQVWDAIYYVPGLDEWLNNYFGHLGLTIDHGNGSQTIVGYITGDNIDAGPGDDLVYGGLGDDHLDGGSGVDFAVFAGSAFDYSIYNSGLDQATVTGPAGTDVLQNIEALQFDDHLVPLPVAQAVQTDTSDQFVWASITTNCDWQGNAIEILYQNDDGSSWFYQYDSLDQFAWNRIQTLTDLQGNVTKQLYDQNDGSHISYVYDANNIGDWARITSYLTSDWQRFSKQIYDEDDGSHAMYLYDVNNTGLGGALSRISRRLVAGEASLQPRQRQPCAALSIRCRQHLQLEQPADQLRRQFPPRLGAARQ
ncbi:hypothetical protein [Bradyrhizobium sp. sBnM-33]|uniref:hypothetical protein n=1 Tax=Bradyrhizobium sp. sBnM-33 TaxID=2831780 RepID=UPI001BD1B60E|nr:hypothetical protein [Bradyrhizobium sp. sBnM-33]WOH48854.1 hypothetical protein RX328_32900 [Bradyrhizobium sp. sBnM-33]